VVALAAISDLRSYGAAPGGCNAAVAELLGGGPEAQPARYAAASPAELLPFGVPLRLVHGALDPIVPLAQSEAFAARARAAGDDVAVAVVEGGGHFDVVASFSPAWGTVRDAVLAAVAPPARAP
jgi:acetyl esterase/lipase